MLGILTFSILNEYDRGLRFFDTAFTVVDLEREYLCSRSLTCFLVLIVFDIPIAATSEKLSRVAFRKLELYSISFKKRSSCTRGAPISFLFNNRTEQLELCEEDDPPDDM